MKNSKVNSINPYVDLMLNQYKNWSLGKRPLKTEDFGEIVFLSVMTELPSILKLEPATGFILLTFVKNIQKENYGT